jgi:2-polyprenyl-3-methyl-5-hydroxy-6-metoxy-1,4-benzoquinol methylase
MSVSFTSHNIRLDDGSFTKPDVGYSMDVHPWFLAARRVLDATFPGDKRHLRIADLGCLEGGYTVEFARLGLQALGLDVRQLNIEACRYVQSKVNLRTWNSRAMMYGISPPTALSMPFFVAVFFTTWTSRASS